MQSLQTPEHQCTMCGKLSSQWCKQCRSSSYCSRECQKADWPVHKILCSDFLNFSTPPTGNGTHRRGIFFPVDEKKPKFVWVKCEWRDVDGDTYQHVDKKTYIGGGMTDRVWVQKNKMRSRTREDVVTVYVRESGMLDGSKINRCVIEVARGRYMNFCWPGPLLALRSQGLTLDDSDFTDMDMVDFRDAVDVLCSYPDTNINVDDFEPVGTNETPTDQVSGVRINCRGEQAIYGREKFETIAVRGSNPVFGAPVTNISRLVGLPIKVIRSSEDKMLKEYGRTNQEATFLHMNANPNGTSWGLAPMDWQDPAGNVTVVREDRRTLLPQHVEAICHFCQVILLPLFDDDMQLGSKARAKVMKRMTPAEFEKFYISYDSFKKESDPKWKSVERPYLV